MPQFFEPDLSEARDNPFARDAAGKLIRRSYWLDMSDRTLVMTMTKGLGADLTNDQKKAHLADLRREHLIDQVCAYRKFYRQRGNGAQNSSIPRCRACSADRRDGGSCTLSEVAMISPAKKKVAGATFWPQLALTRFRHSGSSQLAFDCSQQSLPATN